MQVKITLNTDNAAFQDGGEGLETAAILRQLAAHFENYYPLSLIVDDKGLFDINGNRVGSCKVKRG